jgi:hypothetical protein
MASDQKAKLVGAINRHEWFHVRPYAAPGCYTERGRFYAATYCKAAEYGKPFLYPDRVFVANPLIGEDADTDFALFGHHLKSRGTYRGLCRNEATRKRAALRQGFDSILLLPPGGIVRFVKTGRIPAKAELCLVDLTRSEGPATSIGDQQQLNATIFCTQPPNLALSTQRAAL